MSHPLSFVRRLSCPDASLSKIAVSLYGLVRYASWVVHMTFLLARGTSCRPLTLLFGYQRLFVH